MNTIKDRRSHIRGAEIALALGGIIHFGIISSPPESAMGQTVSEWRGTVDDKWTNGENWSTTPNAPNNHLPPGTTYDVTISGNAAVSVTLDAAVTVDKLNLDANLGNTERHSRLPRMALPTRATVADADR